MNQHYTKIFAATFLILIAISSKAQSVEYLNANNVRAGIPTGGVLFFVTDSLPQSAQDTSVALFEVPKGSGIKAIFSSSIWMAGMDASNNLHCSAQRYNADDFFDGPLGQPVNQGYRNYYERVFKVTKAQLNVHLNLPKPVPNGQTDLDILLWPGKGNPHVLSAYGVNINDNLAPFIDVYPDGIYDPTMGDLPDICGEEAIFFVFNDVNGPAGPTGAALGVEVRGLVEEFIDDNPALPYEKRAVNNTLFVSYEIENKSSNTYNDFYISQYEDIDLGCFSNDRIGCDTVRNLMLGYNGTTPDNDCQGINGFENIKAAQGIKFLNNDLTAFGYFENHNGIQGDPYTGAEYYNNMQGKWNDGTPYMFGGNGLQGANTNSVTHLFPGNPLVPEEWSEVYQQAGNAIASGDRRMHGSTGPMSFAAGEIKKFDLAFFVSYDSTDTSSLAMYRIVDTLKRDADVIQSFYNNNILACRAAQQPVGISEAEAASIELFPNPANTLINVSSTQQISSLTLLNIQGNQLITQAVNSNSAVLDVSKLASGIYLLQLNVGNNTTTRKVVVK